MVWHEHENGLFEGCERFFRQSYLANLVSSWIPALEGIQVRRDLIGLKNLKYLSIFLSPKRLCSEGALRTTRNLQANRFEPSCFVVGDLYVDINVHCQAILQRRRSNPRVRLPMTDRTMKMHLKAAHLWLKRLRCTEEIAEPLEKTARMEDHYVIPS